MYLKIYMYFVKSLLNMEHVFEILNIHKKTKSSLAFDELIISLMQWGQGGNLSLTLEIS